MNWLAVGPYCWGKGKTREEAVSNAKLNWPRGASRVKRPQDRHFSIYMSEGTFTVDGMGDVRSTKDDVTKVQTSILADG